VNPPGLRLLVAALSPRRPGSVRVGFVVDRVTLGQFLLRVLRFLLSISFHPDPPNSSGDKQLARWWPHFWYISPHRHDEQQEARRNIKCMDNRDDQHIAYKTLFYIENKSVWAKGRLNVGLSKVANCQSVKRKNLCWKCHCACRYTSSRGLAFKWWCTVKVQ
jgi:hypothetical protein